MLRLFAGLRIFVTTWFAAHEELARRNGADRPDDEGDANTLLGSESYSAPPQSPPAQAAERGAGVSSGLRACEASTPQAESRYG